MINFNNPVFSKLQMVDNDAFRSLVDPMLTDEESIMLTFMGLRDGVVFTDRRIIAVNVQGLTGTKKDLTSLPYKTIQAFSAETAGAVDFDCELNIWYAGIGKVVLEFGVETDICYICQIISEHVL